MRSRKVKGVFVVYGVFEGVSLDKMEIHGNALTQFPETASLPALRELVFSDNIISELSDTAFRKNPKLTLLEMSGNPITKVGSSTFAYLPNLKKL
ncbi:leucine-rich repeat-containing G-protein coupled receptor 5 [Caerostris extrusa]|uniref:Leucine-rich repeat-containing G-protein coupled receptor 5 n=1 Tax=Caerostris extrusa TaxID=172846 RepID=A0AAV4XBA9_CAEEX|nr:leucine-rich repeat-containing G-protein coupled receptor 5 [Caerostris extrusa]